LVELEVASIPIGTLDGTMTSRPILAPSAPTQRRFVQILAAVVAISGVAELLAVALYVAGSPALVFLVSGLGSLGLSVPLTELVVVFLGLATIGAAAGIWRVQSWGLALGLGISVFAIVVGLLARDVTSFLFLRGVVVLVVLVRIRHLFSPPVHSPASPEIRPESRPPPLGTA
jgi:hypothetical protein